MSAGTARAPRRGRFLGGGRACRRTGLSTSAHPLRGAGATAPPSKGTLSRPFPQDPLPVECLVGGGDARCHGRAMRVRRWCRELPLGALLRLDDPSNAPERGIYVPAPPFQWLLRSRELDFGQTLLLGCKPCGTYTMTPSGIQERRPALTAPEKIRRPSRDCPQGEQVHPAGAGGRAVPLRPVRLSPRGGGRPLRVASQAARGLRPVAAPVRPPRPARREGPGAPPDEKDHLPRPRMAGEALCRGVRLPPSRGATTRSPTRTGLWRRRAWALRLSR